MNEPNSPGANLQPSRRKRWFPLFGSGNLWRVILGGFLLLITLTALFYAVENFRGKWAWNKAQRNLLAKGEVLEIEKFFPPMPPEEQNLAMAEPFRDLVYDYPENEFKAAAKVRLQIEFRETVYRGVVPGGEYPKEEFLMDPEMAKRYGLPTGNGQARKRERLLPKLDSWPMLRPIDWEEWAEYYRLGTQQLTNHSFAMPSKDALPAEAVLQALSGYNETYQKIRTAAKRPAAQFPIRYEDGFATLLPHLAELKGISRYCSFKASAHLAAGDTEAALDTIQTGIRLAEAISTEPYIISQLVRLAMWHILMQPIWAGMRAHQWDQDQLQYFIDTFSPINFIGDYQLALRGERAMTILQLTHQPSKNLSPPDGTENGALKWAPNGWILQNLARISTLYQDFIEWPVEVDTRRVHPEQTRMATQTLHAALEGTTPYNFIIKLLAPGVETFAKKMGSGQNALHLAMAAAWLELYFQNEGRYPDTLEELKSATQKPLPHDVITGDALRYRAAPGGERYHLYSVGWNETDDGGALPLSERRGKPVLDWEAGDWVWPRWAP